MREEDIDKIEATIGKRVAFETSIEAFKNLENCIRAQRQGMEQSLRAIIAEEYLQGNR